MLKLARLGVAALLGVMMAIALLVPSAFAQSVNTHQGSAAHRVVVSQQVTRPLSAQFRWHHFHRGWGGGWGSGWGGWYGNWGGCGWGCGCW